MIQEKSLPVQERLQGAFGYSIILFGSVHSACRFELVTNTLLLQGRLKRGIMMKGGDLPRRLRGDWLVGDGVFADYMWGRAGLPLVWKKPRQVILTREKTLALLI